MAGGEPPGAASKRRKLRGGEGEGAAVDRRLLLLASRDAPRGVPDDAHLLPALEAAGLSCAWALWDELPRGPPRGWAGGATPLVRSLWEGRGRDGAGVELRALFSRCAEAAPALRADYEAMVATSHKSYLLRLQATTSAPPTVPTAFVPSPGSAHARCARERARMRVGGAEVAAGEAPGALKRLLAERFGGGACVLKPAAGTRCEGVTRVTPSEWDLGCAARARALLAEGDVLAQPLLPPVRVGGSTWGEVNVVVADGEVVHAVHKHPARWGWHAAGCPCAELAPGDEELARMECTCGGVAAAVATATAGGQMPEPLDAPAGCDVVPLRLPLPHPLQRAAEAAAAALAGPCGDARGGCARDDGAEQEHERAARSSPCLCRVDFLPSVEAGVLRWLVSEIEGQWAEYFLRAAPARGAAVAAALARRCSAGAGAA